MTMSGLEKFRAYVRHIQDTTGLDLTGIARRAGLATTTISRPMNPDYVGTPSMTTMGKLEAAFGPLLGSQAVISPAPAAERLTPSPTASRRIPIVGGARGGDHQTIFFDQGHTHGWRPCPPALETVPDAFAVYVVGDSMSPKFDPGSLVYVNPSLPVAREKYVVIDLDGSRAVVKQFLRQENGHFIVRQLNPSEELSIPINDIKGVYRIVMSEEP